MNVLVANAGSSSLKLRVLDEHDAVIASADLAADADEETLRELASGAGRLDAVGHRLVHGGRELHESVVLDERALSRLERTTELAPLHNGPALAVVATLRRLLPDAPHVACFDTAFHSGMPDGAALYALPMELIESHGLRRFGFHGLSHAWAARRAAELLGRPSDGLRLVTCHLGAGASLAAVRSGRSIDTTMGFTPNEGLVMATRSGSVDPGILVWLLRHCGFGVDELDHVLEYESGLRGLSGRSGEMRELVAASDEGDRAARTALEVYVHRLRAGVASMAAAMDGLDALVFTGGVGENSARVRRECCSGLGFLGVRLDDDRNDAAGGEDGDLASPGAPVRALVVHSREDLEIARSVRALLS